LTGKEATDDVIADYRTNGRKSLLPLRQLHRRPPSLLSVEVVDSGTASRSESRCSRVGTGSTNP
jgi:hypothetical protein